GKEKNCLVVLSARVVTGRMHEAIPATAPSPTTETKDQARKADCCQPSTRNNCVPSFVSRRVRTTGPQRRPVNSRRAEPQNYCPRHRRAGGKNRHIASRHADRSRMSAGNF